jgi:hypothetical protein
MDLVWRIRLLLDINNGTQVDANNDRLAISDTEIRRQLEDKLPKTMWIAVMERDGLLARPTTLVEIARLVKSILDIREYTRQAGHGPRVAATRRSTRSATSWRRCLR